MDSSSFSSLGGMTPIKSTFEIEVERKAEKLFGDNHDLATLYKIDMLYDEDEEQKAIINFAVEQMRKHNLKLHKEILSLKNCHTYDSDGNLVEVDVKQLILPSYGSSD